MPKESLLLRDIGSRLFDSLPFPLLLKFAAIKNSEKYTDPNLWRRNSPRKTAGWNLKSVDGRALFCQALNLKTH